MFGRRRGIALTILGIGTAFVFAGATAACSTSADVGAMSDGGETKIENEGGLAADTDATPADAGTDVTLPPPRECSDQNFCHTDIPEDAVLYGIWGDGAGVVWTVSEAGAIYRWDGAHWQVHQQIAETELYAVWGSGPTDVWVAASSGLLHGTGASPQTLSFAPVADLPGLDTVPITSIWGTSADDFWAVGGAQDPNSGLLVGRIVHFTHADGFTEIPIEIPRKEEWDPDPGVAPLGVFGSASSGTWIHGAWFDNQNNASAVLYRFAPGSSTPTRITVPLGGELESPSPRHGPFTGAGVMEDGTVWLGGVRQSGLHDYIRGKAPYADSDWELLYRAQYESDPHFFWGSSANDAWQVGDFGRLRHWDGTTWTQAVIMVTSAPVRSDLYGAWASTKDDFWVVGDGIALHKKVSPAP
jgi:hypothetical protein